MKGDQPDKKADEATRARWDRLQSLFFEALDRDPNERTAFLRHVCGTDRELYEEVESLLASESESFLGGVAIDSAQFDLPAQLTGASDHDPLGGESVGPYRVTRQLGAGGMGAVYLAERADGQFEQTVALKLVKRGMDTDAVVGRFESERQILARLEHPNIGRLLDGGVHIDGRPYFALEYVSGEPITEYCDTRLLSVSARLRLFEDVCRAVAYAHRNLIVHRDLKPSNILVKDGEPSADSRSSRPVVKLLDFGIAKLLTGDDDELFTRTGERVLTPAYAAPEQIRGETITTATDVYGLGVVLYELLTGRRPTPISPISELARDAQSPSVRTSDPFRPSAVATRSVEHSGVDLDSKDISPHEIARVRRTTPDRLRRKLRGDIDTIVMTALRDEPDRRYASAQDLLADLKSYRQHLPVAARPESASYKMKKYLRRHRVGVTAATTVVLLISLLVGFYTVRLAAERDRARLEAQKSEQVAGFMRELFAISDPRESGGEEVSAKQLLDRGAARIDEELAGQPQLRSEMMHLMGEVYSSIGSYAQAEKLLDATLSLRRSQGKPEKSGVAQTLVSIGLLHEQVGRYGAASEVLAEAVSLMRSNADAQPIELADALHGLAFARLRLADFERAESLIEEALQIKISVLGEDHVSVAYSLNILGDVYTFQKRLDEAEQVHLRALGMRKRHLGDAHLDVAYSLHNLGATLRDQQRYAESEDYYSEAMEVWTRHYGGANHQSANTLSQLAFVVGMQGEFQRSDSLQQIAIGYAIESVGREHPKVAAMLIRRGDVLAKAGKVDVAESWYRQGIETQTNVLGVEHPTVTRWRITLGRMVAEQGRIAEGLDLIHESERRCSSKEQGGYDGCASDVAAALKAIKPGDTL